MAQKSLAFSHREHGARILTIQLEQSKDNQFMQSSIPIPMFFEFFYPYDK